MSDDWEDSAGGWGGIDDEVNPSEPSDTSEPSEPSEPQDPGEPSEPDRTSDPSDLKLATPIKQKWNEYPTYLYPDLYDDVQEAFDDIEYACKKEADFSPEKYRHFQAVAWDLALEQLEDMDAEEFLDRVDDLGLRE
ncbi:hypothetical protein [Natrinema sp. H-ect4]|uniref:hypothetical protein n=1 Tax=Natrinema sp. H-ect4 TaxID=3242699 RepID=UPI0035A8FA31